MLHLLTVLCLLDQRSRGIELLACGLAESLFAITKFLKSIKMEVFIFYMYTSIMKSSQNGLKVNDLDLYIKRNLFMTWSLRGISVSQTPIVVIVNLQCYCWVPYCLCYILISVIYNILLYRYACCQSTVTLV